MKVIPKRFAIFRFDIPQTIDKEALVHEGQQGDMKDAAKKPSQERTDTIPENTLVFELHGSQFENRPADRSTKKFKQKHLKDL